MRWARPWRRGTCDWRRLPRRLEDISETCCATISFQRYNDRTLSPYFMVSRDTADVHLVHAYLPAVWWVSWVATGGNAENGP